MSGFFGILENETFQFKSNDYNDGCVNVLHDRYHILFEGEIYNKQNCINTLSNQGCTLSTHSNLEIIAALYNSLKENVVHHLRGMFAFAIWDHQEKTFFAARDPFGIKPFYFKNIEDGILFASKKNDLHTFKTENLLSQEALQHYFSFQFVPEPFSLRNEVQTLQPGHYIVKKANEPFTFHQYEKLSFQPINKQVLDFAKETRQALEHSVKAQMQDVDSIGAFLSGGIDSTTIVALAKQVNPAIKTFTVGFEREGFNEIEDAKETADKLGVENIHKVITPYDFVKELPAIIEILDDPIADPAAVPLYFAAKEASQHVNVVLSGEGADELFGGYNIYREPFSLKWFRYLPRFIKKRLKQLSLILPEGMKGKDYLWRGTTPLAERYIGNAKIFNEAEKQQLLCNYDHHIRFTAVTRQLFEEAFSYDDSLKMQYIDLHTWLRGDILVTANRMTAAHSLQSRFPFLDMDVFHLAKQIPTNMKLTKGTTKYVLRKAMADIVPESVVFRKKLGFPVPLKHWLRNELYDWAKEIVTQSPTEHIIHKQEAIKLVELHALKKQDNSRKIWTILIFMLWHRLYMESGNDQTKSDILFEN